MAIRMSQQGLVNQAYLTTVPQFRTVVGGASKVNRDRDAFKLNTLANP